MDLLLGYAVAGLLVGFLVGLTGVGGGSLMTPLLILLFHFKATVAVGSDLAYSAVMKVFGAAVHKKVGAVDMPLVWKLCVGSVPGSLIGTILVHHFHQHYGKITEVVLSRAIGVTLVLVAVSLLVRSLTSTKKRILAEKPAVMRGKSWIATVPLGFVLGFVVGVTSIGAGAFFAVAFLLIYGLQAHEIVGTDVVHGMILAAAAAIGHVFTGDINYPLVGSLLIGAIPGIVLGSRLCAITPVRVLQPTLASILLVSGVKVLAG